MLQQTLPPPLDPGLLVTLLENTTDEVFILKVLPGNCFEMLYVNGAYRKKFSFTDTDVIGKEINEFIPEEILHSVRQKFNHCVETGQVILFNETFLLKDNIKAESLNQLLPIRGSNNHVEFIAGIFRDITELKNYQDDLQKSKTLLDTIFNTISTGIIINDEKGGMIDANAAAEKILGFSKHDSIKEKGSETTTILRSDNSLMPENEFTCIRTLVDRQPRENELMGVMKEDHPASWINVSAVPVNLPGYGIVVTYQDVTEMVRKKREVEEAKNMLFNIINSSTNMIVFITKNFKVEFFNKAAKNHIQRLSNKTLETGGNALDYLPQSQVDIFLEHVGKVEQKIPVTYEHKVAYPDGGHTWLMRRYFPIYDLQNEYMGFVISSTDITEIKQNELQIKMQNQQLREIAKMQSHELRKPVANILGLTELIDQNMDNPKVLAEMIQMLKSSAAGLDEIIKSIVTKSQTS